MIPIHFFSLSSISNYEQYKKACFLPPTALHRYGHWIHITAVHGWQCFRRLNVHWDGSWILPGFIPRGGGK